MNVSNFSILNVYSDFAGQWLAPACRMLVSGRGDRQWPLAAAQRLRRSRVQSYPV